MAESQSRKRLGRGLASLIGDLDQPSPEASKDSAPVAAERSVPVEQVRRNPVNPRQDFDETELEELASSVRRFGIVQPILVRPVKDGSLEAFEIIAGERRWRAAQRAQLDTIPVVVRELDDREALELAIVENVQRSDLNPVEEAAGYRQLIDEHDYTQAELGGVIGRSRSHIANTLRLLNLPASVQSMLADGSLSAGHARALIPLDDPSWLADEIASKGLSVRDAERLAQDTLAPKKRGGPTSQTSHGGHGMVRNPDIDALERRLSDRLGLAVTVAHRGDGSGKLSVVYRDMDQLESLIGKLEN